MQRAWRLPARIPALSAGALQGTGSVFCWVSRAAGEVMEVVAGWRGARTPAAAISLEVEVPRLVQLSRLQYRIHIYSLLCNYEYRRPSYISHLWIKFKSTSAVGISAMLLIQMA